MFLYDCCVACWKIGDLPKEEFLRRERKIESLKPKSAKKGGKVRVTKTAIDCIDKQCPDSAKSVKFDDAIFQRHHRPMSQRELENQRFYTETCNCENCLNPENCVVPAKFKSKSPSLPKIKIPDQFLKKKLKKLPSIDDQLALRRQVIRRASLLKDVDKFKQVMNEVQTEQELQSEQLVRYLEVEEGKRKNSLVGDGGNNPPQQWQMEHLLNRI